MNRFEIIIRKFYIKKYLEERDYLKVIREYNINHLEKDSQYIQDCSIKYFNLIIICFFREQVKWLLEL